MDRFLGPYPSENFKKWISLTSHVTEDLLQRLQPLCKKLSSSTEVVQDDLHSTKATSPAESQSPLLQKNENTVIRFTEIPKQKYPVGASPDEVSKCCMDSSYAFNSMINQMKG